LSQNHPGLLVVRTNSARTRVELEWSEPVTHMELDEPKAREIAALILRDPPEDERRRRGLGRSREPRAERAEGLRRSRRAPAEPGRVAEAPKYCDACFTGDYPIRLTDFAGRDQPAQLSLLAERA